MNHLVHNSIQKPLTLRLIQKLCLLICSRMVKGYRKIDKFLHVLYYFATQEWHFQNNNTQALWKKLNESDKRSFEFSLDLFDWDSFLWNYVRGSRVYLCKDPMETIPQGRIKYRNLQIAHYTLCTVLLFVLGKFILLLWRFSL